MVDGYDELPEEYQKKVDFALKNGHVPDEDWKGVSRLPNTSMSSKTYTDRSGYRSQPRRPHWHASHQS